MSNPVEQYFQEKKASQLSFPGMGGSALAGTGKKLLGAAGNAAVVGSGAAMAAGLGVAASKIYDAITKKNDFHALLQNNEDLQQQFEENPKFFNLAYSSLRSTSPQFAKDPLVAGHYMRRIMENQGSAGGLIMEAMNNAPKMQRGTPVLDAFSKGSLEGAKSALGK